MNYYTGTQVIVKISGDAVPFVGEAMETNDNRIYSISDPLKRVWDYNSPVAVYNATERTTEDFMVDYTSGKIIFSVEDATRFITVDASYVTTTKVAKGKKFSLKQSVNVYDVTEFGDSYKKVIGGLKSAEGSFSDFNILDTFFSNALENAKAVLIEFYTNENDTNPKRIWAVINEIAETADVNDLQGRDISFTSTGNY